MTNKYTSSEIADDIDKIKAQIANVNAAIPIFGEAAIQKANELTASLNDAKERLASALADEQIEARKKRLSGFSDIRVDSKPGDNLISTGFVIRYMKDTWDCDLKKTVPKQHECNGFASLANDAFDYLVSVKPEAIPARIMALAPGEPHKAMSVYLAGKARGYFKGRTVAA
ncbi:hypothetical protein [Sphingomonas sp. IW22]|uniref:hypothetical protein n=1 Tax=Sphingomonas sp. IW22 TaxID=3242489 RepID=UPI00352230A5